MRSTPKPAILLDIDNTLYDWASFFAPSFRAMIHALARVLGLGEDTLFDEAKEVFAQHESLEYAFLIQELASVRGRDPEEIKKLILTGRGAFNSVKRVRLKPYEGVKETLDWASRHGFIIIGVTNSPAFLAQKRLYDLKVDRTFSGLIAWEGFARDKSDKANEGFVPEGRVRDRSRIDKTKIWTLAVDDCKPSPRGYALAVEEFCIDPALCWVVGDSLEKDLKPAASLGLNTVWAKYGSGFDPSEKDMATLLRVTHWSPARIHLNYHKDEFKPDYVIDCFSELLRILPGARQLSLFSKND